RLFSQGGYFYACSGYHLRARTVCENNADAPMMDTNEILREALLDEVLDEKIVTESVNEALRLLQGEDSSVRIAALEKRIAKIDTERKRLANAIAMGGQLEGLLEALKARENQLATYAADRAALRSENRLRASDADHVRDELLTM